VEPVEKEGVVVPSERSESRNLEGVIPSERSESRNLEADREISIRGLKDSSTSAYGLRSE